MGCSSSSVSDNNEKNINREYIKKNKNDNSNRIGIKRSLTKHFISRNRKDFDEEYKFIQVLNKGTKFKLSKVLHFLTNQHRACKQLYKSNLKFIDGEKEFKKEVEFIADLDHPNIPKLFEYFVEDKCYLLILELATGSELLTHIENVDNFSERQAAMIMEQLFSCLNYLHARDIIHQNILPENIYLETNKIGDYNVKLVNFEKARLFNGNNSSLNPISRRESVDVNNIHNNISIVNLYFIAPEVLEGKIGKESDIWSCGVIMYLLLSGYPPFFSEDENELVELIKKGKFDMNGQDWQNISKDAKSLITSLLTVNPKKRISAEQAIKHSWISHLNEERNSEREKNNLLKINHKITKFSSQQKLEQAAIAFIVHQNSSNNTAKQLREIFKMMDTSGDGRLTLQELNDGYEKYFKNTNMTKKEFEELVSSIDKDQSHYIEFEEFLATFINKEMLLSEKNLEYAFKCFDTDKSGKLNTTEIKKILGVMSSNDKSNDKLVEQIILENDANKDGEISFIEFKNLMKKIIKQ